VSLTDAANRERCISHLGLTSIWSYQKPRRTAQAVPPRAGPSGELSPQLTAFFTSAPILASSAAVNSVRAKAVGHMAASSRFA
jgi:hypothetical protein